MSTTKNNLKKLREAAGLSITQLAAMAGVTENSIRRYEAGPNIPLFLTARRIGVVLHASLDRIWPPEKIGKAKS